MTLSVVYGVLMFVLVVIFLINSIRYRKEIKNYVKYGLLFCKGIIEASGGQIRN